MPEKIQKSGAGQLVLLPTRTLPTRTVPKYFVLYFFKVNMYILYTFDQFVKYVNCSY